MQTLSIDKEIAHIRKRIGEKKKYVENHCVTQEFYANIEYYEQLAEWLEELKQYKNAEEQGLLVKLPCAIGTTVYAVVRECEGDSFECYHTCDTCTWSDTHIKEVIFDIEYISDVGNWIFLTKEEAEQALAEMKGEGYGR